MNPHVDAVKVIEKIMIALQEPGLHRLYYAGLREAMNIISAMDMIEVKDVRISKTI